MGPHHKPSNHVLIGMYYLVCTIILWDMVPQLQSAAAGLKGQMNTRPSWTYNKMLQRIMVHHDQSVVQLQLYLSLMKGYIFGL